MADFAIRYGTAFFRQREPTVGSDNQSERLPDPRDLPVS